MVFLQPDGLVMGVLPWGQGGCSQHSCGSADWLCCLLPGKDVASLLPFGTDVFASVVFLIRPQVLAQEERLWLLPRLVGPNNYVPTVLSALLTYVTYLWLSAAITLPHLSVFPTQCISLSRTRTTCGVSS